LAVLASADVTFTTSQIHRVLQQFSDEGIRKVLHRLTAQGVVHTERVGNTFAYKLNTAHLAAQPILDLARLRNTFFDRLEERFLTWTPQPVYAAVFGSVATGLMSVTSDVDLFLVREDDDASVASWEAQVYRLVADVPRWTGNEARVVQYTCTELLNARSEPLIADVVNQGITVAGSRAWLVKKVLPKRNTETDR
jgi:hypothetical protein